MTQNTPSPHDNLTLCQPEAPPLPLAAAAVGDGWVPVLGAASAAGSLNGMAGWNAAPQSRVSKPVLCRSHDVGAQGGSIK